MGRRYANPPVVEALCEISFAGGAWDPTVPGLFYYRVRDRFSEKSRFEQAGFEFEPQGEQATVRMLRAEPRVRFGTPDGARLVQVGKDLVVVNQLRPYPQFEK